MVCVSLYSVKFKYVPTEWCSLDSLRNAQSLTCKRYQRGPKTALALFSNDGLKDLVAILWIVVFGFPPDEFWLIQDVIDVEMRFWIVPNVKSTVAESTLSKGLAKLCSSWNFLSTWSAAPFPAFPGVPPRGATASLFSWQQLLLCPEQQPSSSAEQPEILEVPEQPHPALLLPCSDSQHEQDSSCCIFRHLCWVSVAKSYLAITVSKLLIWLNTCLSQMEIGVNSQNSSLIISKAQLP